MGEQGEPSADLAKLLRWELSGGTSRLISLHEGVATVSLRRCDGGEEADRLVSSDPALLDHLNEIQGQ